MVALGNGTTRTEPPLEIERMGELTAIFGENAPIVQKAFAQLKRVTQQSIEMAYCGAAAGAVGVVRPDGTAVDFSQDELCSLVLSHRCSHVF